MTRCLQLLDAFPVVGRPLRVVTVGALLLRGFTVEVELLSEGQALLRLQDPISTGNESHVQVALEINDSGQSLLVGGMPEIFAMRIKKSGAGQQILNVEGPGSVGLTEPSSTPQTNGTSVNDSMPRVRKEPRPNMTSTQGLLAQHLEFGASLIRDLHLYVFNTMLAFAACVLIYMLRMRPRPNEAQGTCERQENFLGIETSFQMAVFVMYVFFSCTHLFLQHRAGSTGYSTVSATILIYLAKFLCALFMHLCKGDTDFSALLEPTGGPIFGRVPTCVLTLLPGACLGGYDALSFLSLAALDPVTYQVVLHTRLVFIALLWQFTFRRQLSATQWFALVLFAAASATKGLEQIKEVGVAADRGLLIALVQIILAVSGNVMAEFLLKEVPVPTDLLNACLYLQGLLALLAAAAWAGGANGVILGLLAPSAWKALLADPWMLSSVACMTAFGIVTAYFLRELSNLLKELSACFVIIVSAAVEWGLLGSSPCTGLAVQSVILAVLAVGVYNAEPLSNRRKNTGSCHSRKA